MPLYACVAATGEKAYLARTLTVLGKTNNSEAWRYQGPFTRMNRFRGSLPGLGTAIVAFALFNVYEYVAAGKLEESAHH